MIDRFLFSFLFFCFSCKIEKFHLKASTFYNLSEENFLEEKKLVDENIFPGINWNEPTHQYFENKVEVTSFTFENKEKKGFKIISFIKSNKAISVIPYFIIPKKRENLSKNLAKFSGMVCFYKKDGGFKLGYHLEKGIIISTFKKFKKNYSTKKTKRNTFFNSKPKKIFETFTAHKSWGGPINKNILYNINLQEIIEKRQQRLNQFLRNQARELEKEEKNYLKKIQIEESVIKSNIEIQNIAHFLADCLGKNNPWPYPVVVRTFDPEKGFEKIAKWILLSRTYRKSDHKFYGNHKGDFYSATNFFDQSPLLLANSISLDPYLGLVHKGLLDEVYPDSFSKKPKNFAFKKIKLKENIISFISLKKNKKSFLLEEELPEKTIETDIKYFVLSKKGNFLNLKIRLITNHFPYPEVFIVDRQGKKIFLTKPLAKKNQDEELDFYFGEKVKINLNLRLKVKVDQNEEFLSIYCEIPHHFHDEEYYDHL